MRKNKIKKELKEIGIEVNEHNFKVMAAILGRSPRYFWRDIENFKTGIEIATKDLGYNTVSALENEKEGKYRCIYLAFQRYSDKDAWFGKKIEWKEALERLGIEYKSKENEKEIERNKEYEIIAELLRKKPGINRKEIAKAIDKSERTVRKKIRKMKKLRKEKERFEDISALMSPEEKEKKIINTVLENPETHIEDLSKKIGLEPAYIYDVLSKRRGISEILTKYSKIPVEKEILPEGYWETPETRRLFFKWMTCMFSIASGGGLRSKNIEYVPGFGLKKFKAPGTAFLFKNIRIYDRAYRHYKEKLSIKQLYSDWIEASQSIHIKFLQDCFKIFDKGYVKNGLKSDKIYAHYNGSPPKNSKPIYFYVTGKRRMYKLRKKIGEEEGLERLKTFYTTLKTLKNLNFIEKKEFTIIGGRWDKHKKDCYIITLDFEREKFKKVFDKLGVDIWDKPNNNIRY